MRWGGAPDRVVAFVANEPSSSTPPSLVPKRTGQHDVATRNKRHVGRGGGVLSVREWVVGGYDRSGDNRHVIAVVAHLYETCDPRRESPALEKDIVPPAPPRQVPKICQRVDPRLPSRNASF